MSESKVQVKVGIIEFSGEGEQEWLAKQLDKILETLPELLRMDGLSLSNPVGAATENDSKDRTKSINGFSVLNIAGKLHSKSGSDLAIVAAAYLHFVEGKSSFTRDDISSTMKKATGVYKDSYLSNLTGYLAQLEKGSIFLKSGNTYSLSASKVNELNAILLK